MRGFSRQITAALRMFALLSLILGLIYPLVMTGVAWAAFRDQAAGSPVTDNGRIVGSALLGQENSGDEWFQSRPSASRYAGDVSGGSNLSPVGAPQREAVQQRRDALRHANPDAPADIPADALTASASGLDPDISVAYALWQAPRVARARHLNVESVRAVIADHTTRRSWGFLGTPRVNVLDLNLTLSHR
nr:potassium-transporting ATPase subunit KdpC [Austwickia sp. TVS 96-490-7B]